MDAKSAWPIVGSALLLGAAALRHTFKGPIRSQPKPGAGAGDPKSDAKADAKSAVTKAKGSGSGSGSGGVTIVPMTEAHVKRAGEICEAAFNGFAERIHGQLEFVPGLPAMIFGAALQSMADGTCFVCVAVDTATGEVVGSNMIDYGDGIGGIGPISVDPQCQASGVGKQLMQSVIAHALARGIKDVRLVQVCDNKVSWSLYTKLGFASPLVSGDFRGLKNSKLLSIPVAEGLTVRDMTSGDLKACDALVHAITPDQVRGRAHGIAASEHFSWARLVAVDNGTGEVVGWTTGFRIDGFTYARSLAAVQSLLCEYARRIAKLNAEYDVVFHVPLRLYPELVRWILHTAQLRLERQVTAMQLHTDATAGVQWRDPDVSKGFYLHSVSY